MEKITKILKTFKPIFQQYKQKQQHNSKNKSSSFKQALQQETLNMNIDSYVKEPLTAIFTDDNYIATVNQIFTRTNE